MPQALWPLVNDRPVIQVILTNATSNQPLARVLLADTGAGRNASQFDQILAERDCQVAGGTLQSDVVLSGAVRGVFPRYMLRVRIPMLFWDKHIRVVALPVVPDALDGIACFPFLNRFTYGNFGNPGLFGLEV